MLTYLDDVLESYIQTGSAGGLVQKHKPSSPTEVNSREFSFHPCKSRLEWGPTSQQQEKKYWCGWTLAGGMAGWQLWEFAGNFPCSRLMPSGTPGSHLRSRTMQKSMFFLEFPAARGFQKQTCCFCWIVWTKQMCACESQIYWLLKVNYLCVTTPGTFPCSLTFPDGRKPLTNMFRLLPVCTIPSRMICAPRCIEKWVHWMLTCFDRISKIANNPTAGVLLVLLGVWGSSKHMRAEQT